MAQTEARYLSTYANGEVIKALCTYDNETHEITDIAYIDRPHIEGWGDPISEKLKLGDQILDVIKKDEQYYAVV